MLTNPLVGAALSRVDPRGTTVVPQFSPSYDPRRDPRNQPKKGYLRGIFNTLTGGADPMEALSGISTLRDSLGEGVKALQDQLQTAA